ncbi:MAG: ZIP family metal transporter [Acidobacteriia bacterium]|nr:ZIP family metal transporter [Terriglobia bacterium]
MISLLAIKIAAIVAILAVAAVGGAIPILATRHHASHRLFSLGNSLAGGIFLGAGFIHLLPEAAELLGSVVEYPLAPLLAAVGVALLLLIDRVVLETRVGPDQDTAKSRPIYPYVLLVVLSIHSATAGVALGLQSEAVTSLLVIVAILCHKGSAGFALVVSMVAAGAERRQLWTVLAIFASMTPLGIVLGTIASGLLEGPTAVLVEGSFNALAAGTFIYIAILDVINAEMSSADDRVAHFVRSAMVGDDDLPMPVQDTDRVLKFALVVVGLISMAAIGIWI